MIFNKRSVRIPVFKRLDTKITSWKFMKILYFSLFFSLIFTSCSKIDVKELITKTQALLSQGDYKNADLEISKCKKHFDQKPKLLVLAALAKAGNNKSEEALLIIQKAQKIFIEKKDSEALTHLGYASYIIKDYSLAMELLLSSWELNPENIYTATLLINTEFKILKESRKYALRNKHLNIVEKFDSLKNSIQYLNILAVTKAVTNIDRSYIIRKLGKACKINPNDPTTLLNLAVISDSVFDQKRRALTYYNKYLEAVEMLPKDNTQIKNVQRRVTELQNL